MSEQPLDLDALPVEQEPPPEGWGTQEYHTGRVLQIFADVSQLTAGTMVPGDRDEAARKLAVAAIHADLAKIAVQARTMVALERLVEIYDYNSGAPRATP